ncbi:hypothetical protein SAMN05216299_10478 [Nitrosospira sp. Nsp14]|nr:hypothetical protein SAMN05216299_10478 [Nitrosospira sp. Nsp14]
MLPLDLASLATYFARIVGCSCSGKGISYGSDHHVFAFCLSHLATREISAFAYSGIFPPVAADSP